ncbi:WYL domain-containing protein [Actinomadura sp. NPDC049753]|uniref:WYL domain-containing protein n=1 Tax=Actinomadura sp. NPDC049753 TaxID=3154739 RepID=UPI003438F0C9
MLIAIATGCRDHEVLRFEGRSHEGHYGHREAEPHRLVHSERRWYLVGWDISRRDRHTYRVDRPRLKTPNGPLSSQSATARR